MHPVIAISIGDVYGVGPEVILKSFVRSDLFTMCRPVVFGPFDALAWYRQRLGALVDLQRIDAPEAASEGAISVIDTGGHFDPARVGSTDAGAGTISLEAITRAYEEVSSGRAQALVTAPISKAAIMKAGSPFHGHTDMLASLCSVEEDVIMILSSNTMKVGLVTIHIPLAEVPAALTEQRVLSTVRAGHLALRRDFGVSQPRLAVLALNPHAGDEGHLGSEEQTIISPAIAKAVAEGIAVDGPFPADGFFSTHNREQFDMIIAMYHDQGLIPFKMQARGRGVNVSAGLPIIRTSPDHGTAHAIAGRGIASADSMREAILAARSIAVNRARAAGAQ